MTMRVYLVFTCLLALSISISSAQRKVSSRNLPDEIKANKYLLILAGIPSSTEYKAAQLELKQLTTKSDDVVFVHLNGKHMSPDYAHDKQAALIFYRQGKPVIYDGVHNLTDVKKWISSNKESALKKLDDYNFEHLTKGESWLVIFGKVEADTLKKHWPVLETTASKLRAQQYVGYVDKSSNNQLAYLFEVKEQLRIIYIRSEKAYEYSINKIDAESLAAFALGGYKNVEAFDVPRWGWLSYVGEFVHAIIEDPTMAYLRFLNYPYYVVLATWLYVPFTPKYWRKPDPPQYIQ